MSMKLKSEDVDVIFIQPVFAAAFFRSLILFYIVFALMLQTKTFFEDTQGDTVFKHSTTELTHEGFSKAQYGEHFKLLLNNYGEKQRYYFSASQWHILFTIVTVTLARDKRSSNNASIMFAP